MIIIYYRSVT